MKEASTQLAEAVKCMEAAQQHLTNAFEQMKATGAAKTHNVSLNLIYSSITPLVKATRAIHGDLS